MTTFCDEPISPELALVDPVLRERLLRELLEELSHDRTVELQRASDVVERLASNSEASLPGRLAPEQRRRRIRTRGSAIAAVTLMALFLALPSLAFLPPRHAPRLGAELWPLRQDTIIAWQPDPTADYYVFELLAGGKRVKVESVRGASITLGGGLAPDRYAWRVFVGRGLVADHDKWGPIASGTLGID